jgi:Fe2+ transport system protein FeoA
MLGTNIPPAPLATFTHHDGILEVIDVWHSGPDGSKDRDSKRMCELGICVGKKLRIIRHGDPAIVAIDDSRFALAAELLAKVFVRPVNTRS